MVERIIVQDALNKGVEDDSVDLIVTSPPYNLGIDYENYTDDGPYEEYLQRVEKFLGMFYRVLRDDGRFCIVVPQRISKGGIHPIESDYIKTLQKVGLKYQTSIIWYKGDCTKLLGGPQFSAEQPYIRDNTEAIIVGYKKRWKKFRKGESDMTRQEYREISKNIWTIAPAKKSKTKHPAAFPDKLAERCIKLFSYTKDTIYDPFSGSGTTCLMAEKLNRRWIGTDIGQGYVSASRKKMKDVLGDIWYTFDLD